MPRMMGDVMEWSSAKGYGFIRSDAGVNLFVHHSGVASGQLAVGERVDFVRQAAAANERTDQAVSVRVRPQPPPQQGGASSSSGAPPAGRAPRAAVALVPRSLARKKKPAAAAAPASDAASDAQSASGTRKAAAPPDGAPPPKRSRPRLSGEAAREAHVLGYT